MPLIVISGYPSSGKSYRAEQLIAYFRRRIAESTQPQESGLQIQHVSDAALGISTDVYALASRAEKDARASFSSAIKRHLSPSTLVVADGMNYIKGFRYQLYCEAKAVYTTSCVVHVAAAPAQCRELSERSRAYDPETLENLIFRYEEPNGMNRWDSPLFTIPFDDADVPGQAIWEALIGENGRKAVRPNAATVLKPAAEQDYLYELDKTTSDIIYRITTWQADHPGEGGGEIALPDSDQTICLPVLFPGLPLLQRLRRQFIALNRQHSLSKSRIRDLFVDYLNDAFQS